VTPHGKGLGAKPDDFSFPRAGKGHEPRRQCRHPHFEKDCDPSRVRREDSALKAEEKGEAAMRKKVKLTIFGGAEVEADHPRVRIKAGDSVVWKVSFAKGDVYRPNASGVKIRFVKPRSSRGPFEALVEKGMVITGRNAEKNGPFNYNVSLKRKVLRWRPAIRAFGGVDVGGPRI
jgi:hypothetical protein